jgi:hypothetical protein
VDIPSGSWNEWDKILHSIYKKEINQPSILPRTRLTAPTQPSQVMPTLRTTVCIAYFVLKYDYQPNYTSNSREEQIMAMLHELLLPYQNSDKLFFQTLSYSK